MKPARRIGPWHLGDLEQIEQNGIKVFSCFHCGGGSTMGYKLAGCEVLGGVELDPEMMAVYRSNFHPRHSYLMGVQQLKLVADAELPAELFDLDILDGSPPCSAFSISGSREEKWGGEHHFREGQAAQHLDDLFFEFIDIAAKLKPKAVIAENVKGLIVGNARGYVKQIFAAFDKAGYSTQLFLLNAAAMGVPQRRERTVFIAVRKDIGKRVALTYKEPPIPFGVFAEHKPNEEIIPCYKKREKYLKPGERSLRHADAQLRGKESFFNHMIIYRNQVLPTMTTNLHNTHVYDDGGRKLSPYETAMAQSFPLDYDYGKAADRYIQGMSVPPFMMQRVALDVCEQIFGIEYDRQIIDAFRKPGMGDAAAA